MSRSDPRDGRPGATRAALVRLKSWPLPGSVLCRGLAAAGSQWCARAPDHAAYRTAEGTKNSWDDFSAPTGCAAWPTRTSPQSWPWTCRSRPRMCSASRGVRGTPPVRVVGTDGRASGEFLSAAVMAGLASAGVDVMDAGMLPTPAIAFLTADLGADIGVMLSASHNPMPDNGIKFFARGGHKLDDAVEDAIEARLQEPWERPTGRTSVGSVASTPAAPGMSATSSPILPHRLEGLHVVIDAAHGAASSVSPWSSARPAPM
jgi:hypothetical protein